ncbi:SRPBCC family protein [Nocardioides limicola]|uniref:SRPBCC family protein n=1 Tax=Nocardioides limicola TaxID=2803368 RepID=UPI00193C4369|nr:SRPBCC family protein [Nocardioides sp. DJM-14]
MEIRRIVTTRAPLAAVFDYLADFSTTTEWDPGTVRTTRVDGDGGVGTRYENISRFLGRQTRLIYVVEEFVPLQRIALRGENDTVLARDAIDVSATIDGGTQVTYHASFDFHGVGRVLAPLLAPAFRRLGDKGARGLAEALTGLTGRPDVHDQTRG